MNIYSDSSHIALKYLKNIEVNIDNVLIMTGDFNIRDSLWDTSFPYHFTISDDLMIVADSFNLVLLTPTNPCPTRYSDMAGEANSVMSRSLTVDSILFSLFTLFYFTFTFYFFYF